ncbi:hypothetical protein AHF37_02422 [Paragonimus kellicotti]|nr:hypothetical protein AHF37_02422 [Paragonimus kellicotti]
MTRWLRNVPIDCCYPLATTVVAYCLLSQAVSPVGCSSDVLDVISREELLRKLVNYVKTEGLFCSLSAWSRGDRNHFISKEGATKDMSNTFHPLFREVFTPTALITAYVDDIQRAARIVRTVNQLCQPPKKISSSILTDVLKSLILAETSVRMLSDVNPIFIANWNNLTATDSTWLGIGVCKGTELLAYASRHDDLGLDIPRKVCLQHSDSTTGTNDSDITLQDDIYGQYYLRWMADHCEPIPLRTAFVRLLIRTSTNPNKLHFFFELDLRNFTVDQCSLNIHLCGTTTKCEYKQYDDWFFAVDNYICRCADSYYLDNEDNVSHFK